MSSQYVIRKEEPQVPCWTDAQMSQGMLDQLAVFLYPLLWFLDRLLDKRLVRTCLQTVQAILIFRERAHGLLLSELGGYLLGPEQAAAGTKRVSNLIHSSKWGAWVIERFVWQRADEQLQQWEQQAVTVLADWDGSQVEKPESRVQEGLCRVPSGKAARRVRHSRGRGGKPIGQIRVPGLHWLAVLLVGLYATQGSPVLAATRWWSTQGGQASFARDEELKLLLLCLGRWGRRVIHVFDRGFAGQRWLAGCLAYQARFIQRWRHQYHLLDAKGQSRPAWRIAQGKRAWGSRQLWSSRGRHWVPCSVLALPVRHQACADQPLWLVVARGWEHPWYLLTAEPIQSEEDAWEIVLGYFRRWQIELMWRYDKSELAFESLRVRRWEHQVKLLLLATLAYAFLLTLLHWEQIGCRAWLLRCYCHRTGAHQREAVAPLYRLRHALSRLWQKHPPNYALLGQPPPSCLDLPLGA